MPERDKGISYLQFDVFRGLPVTHGVFRRYGGESPPPFDSLNVSYGVGDEADNVRKNRRHIKRALGLRVLVSARQVHGDRVLVVDSMPTGDFEAAEYDGLITDQPGVGLMVQQADCQAVLLAEKRGRAVGICHSGWRGSVANIISSTIRALEIHFAVGPEDLVAAISPSLGPCCAEFVNYRSELPEPFWKLRQEGDLFDFWTISALQLRDAGVDPGNIGMASICTVCDKDFFSYRRQRVTGRFASVIGISS